MILIRGLATTCSWQRCSLSENCSCQLSHQPSRCNICGVRSGLAQSSSICNATILLRDQSKSLAERKLLHSSRFLWLLIMQTSTSITSSKICVWVISEALLPKCWLKVVASIIQITHTLLSATVSVLLIFSTQVAQCGPDLRSGVRLTCSFLSWHLYKRCTVAFGTCCFGFCGGFDYMEGIWDAALWLDCFTYACGKGLTLRMSPIWLTYYVQMQQIWCTFFRVCLRGILFLHVWLGQL